MYGISVRGLVRWLRSSSLGEWPHVGKNVTLFSYMVMQYAAHLEIYPLRAAQRGPVWPRPELHASQGEGRGGGGGHLMLIRSCGSYETHGYRQLHGRIVQIASRSFASP